MSARGGHSGERPRSSAPVEVPVGAVDVRVYTVPTDAPEADGTFAWDATTMVLVRATAPGDHGEVVGTGWTYGPAACATVVRDQLAERVVGRCALDVTGSYLAMAEAVRNVGRPGVAAMALAAVDTALWDLKARLLDLPLHKLFGAVTGAVDVYGSGGFTTYDDARLAEQLTGWVEAGIPRVKIKVGESFGARPARDVHRVGVAREAVGDSAELYVDANGGYTVKQAVRFGREVEQHRVVWFEEPVSSDDLAGLATVREQLSCDVTAGEYGYDLDYFRRMSAAKAVDCLQVDVSRCGGYTEWLRIAAVAAAHHLEVSAHCVPQLHLPVAAATPNMRHLEWFHDHVRIESSFFDGAREPVGGALHVDDRPGHGLALRETDAAAFLTSY